MARIYFINGFMDAGKTTFIKELLEQDYFQIQGKTLLLECEEGDVEYAPDFLEAHNINKVSIENEADFNPENLAGIEKEYKPKRVIIEFNGMWNRKDLEFPWYWEDLVEISIFDATTFDMYSRNMKSLVAEQVRNSLMTIFNRCDTVMDKIGSYRRSVKAVNSYLNVVFYDKDGEMSSRLDEDLPYDIDQDVLTITDETYATFYIDIMENVDRYIGKQVNLQGMVIKKSQDVSTSCILGRFAMTCCAEDLSMFGFVCNCPYADELELDDWIRYSGIIDKDYIEKYDLWYPVIYVKEMEHCDAPENNLVDVV
ncbi:MAG: GTPase [Pseudobutyrivibrio sp.]|nr:GTPase [Pseudobutyrivibrio sp.]